MKFVCANRSGQHHSSDQNSKTRNPKTRRAPHPAHTMPRSSKRAYSSYIQKIVKKSATGRSMTAGALDAFGVIIDDIESRLVDAAAEYKNVDKKSTLGHGHIDAATKVLLPRGLAGHARRSGTAAVKRYITAGKDE